MNKYLKMLSLLSMLSISSLSLAWDWGFTNITDKILVVQVKLAGVSDNFFNVVGPSQKTTFTWGFGSARGSIPFENISIGEYDEKKAKNFPGTNTPQLPKESGKNILDAKKITSAIDARGEWFNSLDQITKNNDPQLYIWETDRWNNLMNKINPMLQKLATGASNSQQIMGSLNLANELKSGTTFGDVASGSPLSKFTSSALRRGSRDFLIMEYEGKLVLVTKR